MSARSEGDETPLWLGARSGGINSSGLEVSRERNFQRARRARERVHGTREYLHSHSEWIVDRSRALMNSTG